MYSFWPSVSPSFGGIGKFKNQNSFENLLLDERFEF
jgi:hypothetical protein